MDQIRTSPAMTSPKRSEYFEYLVNGEPWNEPGQDNLSQFLSAAEH